jgi:hypothetical protein
MTSAEVSEISSNHQNNYNIEREGEISTQWNGRDVIHRNDKNKGLSNLVFSHCKEINTQPKIVK